MSGFESPNYTEAPNDLFDSFLPDMGLAELKVTLVAIRMTFGYHRSKAHISLSEMTAMTGLSKQSVLDGAASAERRGTLSRLQAGRVTEWVINVIDLPDGQVSRPVLVKQVDRSGLAGRPPSIKENLKEKNTSEKNTRLVAEEKPRKRDELFDAIAEVCKADPDTAGSSIAKVKQALLKAKPPYTADEIKAFGKQWWTWKDRTAPPTIWQLKERIGNVRGAGKKPNGERTRPAPEILS